MKYLAACLLLLSTVRCLSQQPQLYVYLQTDNGQPFFVRLDNINYSSALSGYLILAGVSGKALPVTIGFPGNVFPQQQFILPGIEKDAGYVLRHTSNNW